jgi:hypothetical protein
MVATRLTPSLSRKACPLYKARGFHSEADAHRQKGHELGLRNGLAVAIEPWDDIGDRVSVDYSERDARGKEEDWQAE